MKQDLNVYYDISSSKWWFFDQNSGAWIEQEEGQVEELMENEKEEEQTVKRECDNGLSQLDNDTNEQVGGDPVEPKEDGYNYKTQEEGNQNQLNTYDTQSESDFSYEKIIKSRTLRKLAKESDIGYSEIKTNTENPRANPIPNDPNYTEGSSEAQNNNKDKVYQTQLDNGQSYQREWAGTEEAGAQLQANDSIYYEPVNGVGEGSPENYYGTEYDPNAYYSNAEFYNGENADKYYSFYYGTTANNEYNTGYAEEYTQGYGENYDTEYANNYYNGEEYTAQEGVEEGAAYMDGYEAKYNELCDATENQNYLKESTTYYTVPSVNEKGTFSEHDEDDSITNESSNKESIVPEQDTGQMQMEKETEKEKESNIPSIGSLKEQENRKNSEVKDEGNRMNTSSNVTGSSNTVDEKINSLLNSSSKSHLQTVSGERLLDKLISRSRSSSILGKAFKESSFEKDLVSDKEKMKAAQSRDSLTDVATEENKNTEKKKHHKGQVHFSLSSIKEQETKSSIEEDSSQGEQDENEKNEDDVDMDAISVPFVRRATRKLTFKDQGGLSGCIKVFLQKKNELIAEAATKGEDASTRELDIKMANLKRRARELAKRYRSKGTSGSDRDKQNAEPAEESKGDRFLKLVLEVQKKNKEMKEANKSL